MVGLVLVLAVGCTSTAGARPAPTEPPLTTAQLAQKLATLDGAADPTLYETELATLQHDCTDHPSPAVLGLAVVRTLSTLREDGHPARAADALAGAIRAEVALGTTTCAGLLAVWAAASEAD